MFSKVSLTIGVCGNALSAVLGEILSLALSCSWPSHITIVGLSSLEYRLVGESGRDSCEPRVTARVVEDGVADVVLRLRLSPRPWP